MTPKDYADTEPRLVLEDYFLGRTRAHGLFHDRFGNLKRRFSVDVTGTLDEAGVLTLDEWFRYDDGERDHRVWTIRRTAEGIYEGCADDVVGVARGRAAGAVLNWAYDLDLRIGESTWRVRFDDWMILMEDGVLMSRAGVSKWGVRVGEVTLTFRKPSPGRPSFGPKPRLDPPEQPAQAS